MKHISHVALAVLLWGELAAAGAGRKVTLSLPHPLAHGETVWLNVGVGAIGHKQLHVTTADGRELGTISAYGPKAGSTGGTYTLPVPADAISGDHLTILLTIIEGKTEHAATEREVINIRVSIQPAHR